MIPEEIALFFAGIIATWLFARLYYQKSSSEINRNFARVESQVIALDRKLSDVESAKTFKDARIGGHYDLITRVTPDENNTRSNDIVPAIKNLQEQIN
ncbi:MAG: hypothetical protein QXX64_05450 [Nitrososphaera sp.]